MAQPCDLIHTRITRRALSQVGLLALASGALALSGCGQEGTSSQEALQGDSQSQEGAQAADKLVMGITVEPDGLDPHRTAAAATTRCSRCRWTARSSRAWPSRGSLLRTA